MAEFVGTHQPKSEWKPSTPPKTDTKLDAIDLPLTVTDPELIIELSLFPEGRSRQEFALSALRIGILALKQAQGRLDAGTIRNEGDRLLSDLNTHLAEHRQAVTQQMTNSIKEYFDPGSGRFNERLERLLKKDGELEQALLRQIGVEDSALAKTLATHLGETSPLMKLLNPAESDGFLKVLQQGVDDSLKAERECILQQFSLDNKESALSRLVGELTEGHGKLTENIQGSIKEVVGEFSLDNEESALSRLVRRVEQAQKQINSEFSLDTESSALARMKRELLEVLSSHKKENADFQQEVREALNEMKVRKDEAQRSTTHGHDFESELYRIIQPSCQKAGDVATHTGNTTGLIKNCKIGDIVIELGPEQTAAGTKIVIEAKESESYDIAKAREEIEIGRKNRGADIGVFVFSKRTAPEGLDSFVRYGQDVITIWDAEDPTLDVYLHAAVSIARALCTRTATERETQKVDFESIDRAIRDIEKQAQGLDEITRLTGTIKSNSEKILKRASIVQESLTQQIHTLEENISDLKDTLG